MKRADAVKKWRIRDQPLHTSAAINSKDATLISKSKTEFHPRWLHEYPITEKEGFIFVLFYILAEYEKEKKIDPKIQSDSNIINNKYSIWILSFNFYSTMNNK